jgi:transposase InsO family protein
VNRDFTAEKPDKLWTSDITYIWTAEDIPEMAEAILESAIEKAFTGKPL